MCISGTDITTAITAIRTRAAIVRAMKATLIRHRFQRNSTTMTLFS